MTSEKATEEVMANTLPAVLQDETVQRDMLCKDKALYTKISSWLKKFIQQVEEIGKEMARRVGWTQMDALAGEKETLREIWRQMDAVLRENGATKQGGAEEEAAHSIKTLQDGKSTWRLTGR